MRLPMIIMRSVGDRFRGTFRLRSWWIATVPYRWLGSPPCRVSASVEAPSVLAGGAIPHVSPSRGLLSRTTMCSLWASPAIPRATSPDPRSTPESRKIDAAAAHAKGMVSCSARLLRSSAAARLASIAAPVCQAAVTQPSQSSGSPADWRRTRAARPALSRHSLVDANDAITSDSSVLIIGVANLGRSTLTKRDSQIEYRKPEFDLGRQASPAQGGA
jgi:hypothetical protein